MPAGMGDAADDVGAPDVAVEERSWGRGLDAARHVGPVKASELAEPNSRFGVVVPLTPHADERVGFG